jgi:hypothetical protein
MSWKMPDLKAMKEGPGLVAFPIIYDGPDAYAKAFEGTGYGLVFDDDGETGYLYVTSEDFSEVLDALHLYNSDTEYAPKPGETAYFLWSRKFGRAGLFYHNMYIAIVDFEDARACCRSGYPEPPEDGWCTSSHRWDPDMEEGLSFDKIEEMDLGKNNQTTQ